MYETLYRKYRPQTFADLVGQEAIARTLGNAIERDRTSHAYLFAGARGTGKTSTARILAKAINCLNRQGGEPCNACAPCREISGGGAVDILEIDAASNRGIDEIRDLREKVKYLPASLRMKVYIVDEAHMLTTEAFNALLKTLEEPPPHVMFILATTEPHRLPITVLSRCQRFDFRRISEEAMAACLGRIAEAEGAGIAPEALAVLIRRAEGSMRDAISLLDQLLSTGARQLGMEEIRATLGIADPAEVRTLLQTILAHDAAAATRQIARLYAAGVDVREILRALTYATRDAVLEASAPAPSRSSAQALLRIWDALLAVQAELRRGGVDARLLLELVILQLALGESGSVSPSISPASAPPSRAIPEAPGQGSTATAMASADSPARATAEDPAAAWTEVARRVMAVHRPTAALLHEARVEAVDQEAVHLRFTNEMLRQKLQDPAKMALLQQKLAEVFGRPLAVRCTVGPGRDRPAPRTAQPGADEVVRDALSRFDATITRVTVIDQPDKSEARGS